ncbi:MAG: class I SAM-dependent methyltransferase [Nitrospiraceae bacterium]|nr:class I SAM-dependent methyltransferase [Nitrospiraceae bacterium]
MKTKERRDFNKEAAQWDANPGRVKLANDVADSIIREMAPTQDMDVLDFGCGTGLVTLRLQPLVRTITGADSSEGMLGVLEGKVASQGLTNVRTQHADFEKGGRVHGVFHLIVSSMTLHHVPDPAALFRQWQDLLVPGGRVCFADLDAEDGSFHGDNTGVFHLGFDRDRLKTLLQEAGFHDIRDATAATMTKDVEGKGKRAFPVFLITARK